MDSRYEGRRGGIVAGLALFVMAVVSGTAYGYYHPMVIGSVNGATGVIDAEILMQVIGSMRIELILWSITLILDLIVSVGLYLFLRDYNRRGAIWSAGLRLIYTMVLGVGILQLYGGFRVMTGGNAMTAIADIAAESATAAVANMALVVQAYSTFDGIFDIGLIIFGVHLFVTGMVFIRHKALPNMIGWLVCLAGILYTSTSFMKLMEVNLYGQFQVLQDFSVAIKGVSTAFMAIGELALALWLVLLFFKKSALDSTE